MTASLERLTPGMPIPYGGDRLAFVPEELAARFATGDRLIIVQESGELLHVPAAVHRTVEAAMDEATAAFADLNRISDAAITAFFAAFASGLADDDVWAQIARANEADIARARARGASVTRLIATAAMRRDMIAGLTGWRDSPPGRGRVAERVDHEGWSVETVTAPLGVVGFVFEGRPNVLADAVGVLRGGNSVVFRIGADALGTAQAMTRLALRPALATSGLPMGAAVLIESVEHAAAWALFAHGGLGLAVARGSGRAVAQLGAVARQAGTPVSLHGTGGAWLLADDGAEAARFHDAVRHSLDRKVCNTLNVCCIPRSRAEELVPLFLDGFAEAGAARGVGVKLHATARAWEHLPKVWREGVSQVRRADGDHTEALTERLDRADLGQEWEWEESPEVSLEIVADLDEAMALFNTLSPRFAASVIAADPGVQERAFAVLDAAFIGDGMTRWVDGQYAFRRPELGLANWQNGRLFARGGVLSGDGVFTLKTRMRQGVAGLKR
jgi:glutamate-5-semialdehyde dehydrogenase